MKGLFKRVSDTEMTKKDISHLNDILVTKRRKLEQTELEDAIAKAKSQPMPKKWLAEAVTNFENIKGDVSDDDVLAECIDSAHCENGNHYKYCAIVPEEAPNCVSEDCWYENDPTRIAKHKNTHYYVFDMSLHYCDKCIATRNSADIASIRMPATFFIPELRAKIKNNTCPTCAKAASMFCKCGIGCRVCDEGHWWHLNSDGKKVLGNGHGK